MNDFIENHPIFCYMIGATIVIAIIFAFANLFWIYAPIEWQENYEIAVGMLIREVELL